MRPNKFLHALTQRFAEMDESESQELYAESKKSYDDALAKARSKQIQNDERAKAIAANHSKPVDGFVPPKEQVLTLGDKLILQAEMWYTRYGLAIAFIIMLPIVKSYMAGGLGDSEEDEEEREAAEFMNMFARYKQSQKMGVSRKSSF